MGAGESFNILFPSTMRLAIDDFLSICLIILSKKFKVSDVVENVLLVDVQN